MARYKANIKHHNCENIAKTRRLSYEMDYPILTWAKS